MFMLLTLVAHVVESHPRGPKPRWPIRVTMLNASADPQQPDHVIVEIRRRA